MCLHHLQETELCAQQFVLTLQAWRWCGCQVAELLRHQLKQRAASALQKLLSPSPEIAVAEFELAILKLLSPSPELAVVEFELAILKMLSPSPELAVAGFELAVLELLSYLLEAFLTQPGM